MIMMNYLNEMGDEDRFGVVGVMAVSVPWNCMESCYSLEQPINCFLFNKHLTRNLVNMLYRYIPCHPLEQFLLTDESSRELFFFCSHSLFIIGNDGSYYLVYLL